MATTINRLSVAQIARLDKPGRYHDGGGLYLQVTKNRDKINKSWVFRFRGGAVIAAGPNTGKRRLREMGLGNYPLFSLSEARERRKQQAQAWADGKDPIEERRRLRLAEEARQAQARAEALKLITFEQATSAYIADNRAGWGAVNAQQFENTLRDHASSIAKLPVSAIETAHVAAALRPIWTSKHVTAKRVLNRIAAVWNWAKSNKLVSGDNPAAWGGNLDAILPASKKLAVEVVHHEALPFAEVPALMATLRASDERMARIVEALNLTATRVSELLGARWEEIDLEAGRWRAAAQRSKTKQRFDTPLSARLVEILRQIGPKSTGLVFPAAPHRQKPLRIGTLREFLRRTAGRSDISLHGFRASFRNWVAVVHPTRFSADAAEAALGHVRGSKTRRAYERDDLFALRQPMMEAWSDYCAGRAAGRLKAEGRPPTAPGVKVTTLRRGQAA
jgi:integrase